MKVYKIFLKKNKKKSEWQYFLENVIDAKVGQNA